MSFCRDRMVRRNFPLFWATVAWTLLNLCVDLDGTQAETTGYFGGYFRTYYGDYECTPDQLTRCGQLCPGDNLALCANPPPGFLSICYCHETPPDMVDDIKCTFRETTPPGDLGRVTVTNLETFCRAVSKDGFRSRVDVITCENSAVDICVLKDYPDEMVTDVSFGGKDITVDCVFSRENACKDFCTPKNYAACLFSPTLDACYCYSDDQPQNENGYTCTKSETVKPSDTIRTEQGGSLKDQCQSYAAGSSETLDLYICTQPNEETYCIIVGPEPEQDFGGGCSVCKSDSFFSAFVCPFICISVQVVTFARDLFKNIVPKIADQFDFITSTLDSLVGSIGGLLD